MGAQEVDHKLHGFMHYHRRRIQRFFSDCGMFNGHPFMLFLIRHEPGITPAEIARKMEITPASATVSLKRMEAEQLVVRVPDENDRRVVHLYLTPQGEELDNRCHTEKDRVVEATFRDFTAEELALLGNFLDRMRENLKEADRT